MRQSASAALLAAFTLLASPAAAQTFPAKPVRMVVSFAPGGGTDFVARVIGPRLDLATGRRAKGHDRDA